MAARTDTTKPRDGAPPADAGLNRQLYREAAVTHYERWGEEYLGRRHGRCLPMSRWQSFGASVTAMSCLLAAVGLMVFIRLPVTGRVPAVVTAAPKDHASRQVAVLFPVEAAALVQSGITVRLRVGAGEALAPADGCRPVDTCDQSGDGDGTLPVFVTGSGTVVPASAARAAYPSLGSIHLPDRVVIGVGHLPAAALRPPSSPAALVFADGQIGSRSLIQLG